MPVLYEYDVEHYDILKRSQQWVDKHDSLIEFTIVLVGMTVVVQRKKAVPGTMAQEWCMAPKNMITDPTRSVSERHAAVSLYQPGTSSRCQYLQSHTYAVK